MNDSRRHALLHDTNSRQNKLWLVACWRSVDCYIEYRWEGTPYRSRLAFQFEPHGIWLVARSYDDDVRPFLKFGKDGC
jgi:hypothetical protein